MDSIGHYLAALACPYVPRYTQKDYAVQKFVIGARFDKQRIASTQTSRAYVDGQLGCRLRLGTVTRITVTPCLGNVVCSSMGEDWKNCKEHDQQSFPHKTFSSPPSRFSI